MLVKPDERVPLARLFAFIEQGEVLAHDCANSQASIACEPALQRFLIGQARQEKAHAAVFHGAVTWLAPRHLGACPLLTPLDHYRMLIDSALRRNDFFETVLAQQIILEGLGETILKKLDEGLVKRHAPFQRLRRILIQQEESHQGFGHRTLERAIARHDTSPEALLPAALEYLDLVESMLHHLGNLLEEIDEDPSEYVTEVKNSLPDWLTIGQIPSVFAKGRGHKIRCLPVPAVSN